MLKGKPNAELFHLYKDELKLRVRNQGNIEMYHRLLDLFQESLGDEPPSALQARDFLSRLDSRFGDNMKNVPFFNRTSKRNHQA